MRDSCTPSLALALLLGGALAALPACSEEAPGEADPWREKREAMIGEIERTARETARWTGRARLAPEVLDALRAVPRHELVPASARTRAYVDRPLAIGSGQTISQPFIVALMTDLLELGPEDRVLEVGTGSGYQAAVLAELAGEVYTIEIIPELARRAAADLERLGYGRIHTRLGDGYHGWPEAAPFDAVIVTAAAPHVPEPLLAQMAPGGRMVIPVADGTGAEQLTLITRGAEGGLSRREVLPVRFVPLTGDH